MNICVWSGSSFEKPYASYHLMENIILSFLEEGHQVWLIQGKWSNGQIPDSLKEKENFNVINISQKSIQKNNFIGRYIYSLNFYRKSKKCLYNLPQIDVVFLQSNNVAWYPISCIRKKKIPVVYNVQDIFPDNAIEVGMINKNSLIAKTFLQLQMYAFQKSSVIVTISQDMKNRLNQVYGINKNKIYVAYNWSHLSNKTNNYNFFNEQFPLKKGNVKVVYAGNLGKMQNVELIVRTATLFLDYENIEFYIIGSGGNERELKKMVEEANMRNVFFLPMQPPERAQDIYQSADINIIPLQKGIIYTALPSKTADCFSVNKPVIFCIDEESLFAQTLNRYKIPVSSPTDPEELKNAILDIVKNGFEGEPRNCSNDLFQKEENLRIYCECINIAAKSRI